MMGRLLQTMVLLWVVQAAHAGGYSAPRTISNGQGPQPNGDKPQSGGGVGSLLIPSKGRIMGPQNGFARYPTKGVGHRAFTGMSNGQSGKQGGNPAVLPNGNGGYGVKAGPTNGQQLKGYGAQTGGNGGQTTKGYGGNPAVLPNGNGGYGVKAGPTNGQQLKGYGAQTGGNGGQTTKGYGGNPAVLPNGNGGYGVKAGPTNGQQLKGYGAQTGGNGGQGTKGYVGGNPASLPNGNGGKSHGYGVKAGPTNGQQMKGYGAQTGGNGGQGTTGNGGNPAVLPNGNGGYGVKAGPTNGQQLKGYGAQSGGNGGQATGYGVKAGPTNGQLKGYGAQAHGNEGQGTKGYGSGPQANGNGGGLGTEGYNGGYGSAGLTLGPHYGNGGMKGPIRGFGNMPNGYGNKHNGYGPPRQGAVRPQPGYGNGAVPYGYGSKPRGYGAGTGTFKGYGTQANGHSVGNGATLGGNGVHGPSSGSKGVGAPNEGPGTVQNGKGQATQGADVFSGKSYKGGALSPQQHIDTPVENVSPQHETAQGEVPDAPEPTSGILVMVTQEKYQKLPPPVAQGKNYKKSPLIHEATPEPVPVLPEGGEPDHLPEPAPMEPKDKGQKGATTVPVVPESSPVSEPEAESNEDVSVSKGQGPKQAKPDCGPDGQWMKIPRPGYAGSADGYSNGGGAKTNKPGYGAGGNAFPGQSNGYGAGLGYHYGGKPVQPGYGQGAYPPVRYGNSYGGYGQGYRAGPQPDFASFGQGVPPADAKSGGAKQLPFNGAPVVPAGLDGMSQFEPQSADLGPNGNVGGMYGGIGGLPFGGQALGMGAEKSNTKYGIGGLQFGGQPVGAGKNGAGNYGFGVNSYVPAGDGKSHGKYGYGGFPNGGQLPGGNGNAPGYGRLPYEVQQAGLSPEAKSTGQYALTGSPFQPERAGFGPNKKSTVHYGGGEVPYTPQTLGFGGGAKSGKHDKQAPYQSQPLESATEGVTGLMEPDSTEQHYGVSVKAEVPTPGVESEGPIDAYDNVGYINGQVQPEGPAAPTVSTTLENQFVPVESLTPDKLPAEGVHGPESTTSLHEAEPAAESQGEAQGPEQPDDLQQLPRQIHIQQHLKLHFHPQGGKNGKYDLNGFFGNSGYQG